MGVGRGPGGGEPFRKARRLTLVGKLATRYRLEASDSEENTLLTALR